MAREFNVQQLSEPVLFETGESSRISVQKVSGNGKVYIAVQKNYQDDLGTWKNGKGIWLPIQDVDNPKLAEEIGETIIKLAKGN